MTVPDTPQISSAWLEWLHDFRAAAIKVIRETTIQPSDAADEELQSVRCALYARVLSLLGTACLLADNDKQLDLRICCRSIIECAVHLGVAAARQDYVAALKEDDSASRRSRGIAFRKRQPPVDAASRKLLDNFLSHVGKPKRLEPPSELAESSQLPRLAHAHREISADAAHVSWNSLLRHVVGDEDGVTRCVIDPALTAEELHETLTLIGLAVLICTLILAQNLPDGDEIVDRFSELQTRFDSLRRTT